MTESNPTDWRRIVAFFAGATFLVLALGACAAMADSSEPAAAPVVAAAVPTTAVYVDARVTECATEIRTIARDSGRPVAEMARAFAVIAGVVPADSPQVACARAYAVIDAAA